MMFGEPHRNEVRNLALKSNPSATPDANGDFLNMFKFACHRIRVPNRPTLK